MDTQLHILTFATHSEGTYDDLVEDVRNNGMELTVIGWGQKWKGYLNKLENVIEKLKDLSSTDVVIVLDAFDTRMVLGYTKKDILHIYNTKFGGTGVVFSLNVKHVAPMIPEFVSTYIMTKVFGGRVNAGMYIGRVVDLIPLLKSAVKQTHVCRSDDQCAFNKLTSEYKIRVDYDYSLFKNIEYHERHKTPREFNVPFCGYPGTLTWSRLSRVPSEYLPFLWPEVLAVIIIMLVIIFGLVKTLS